MGTAMKDARLPFFGSVHEAGNAHQRRTQAFLGGTEVQLRLARVRGGIVRRRVDL
jgi:hypothetical protein